MFWEGKWKNGQNLKGQNGNIQKSWRFENRKCDIEKIICKIVKIWRKWQNVKISKCEKLFNSEHFAANVHNVRLSKKIWNNKSLQNYNNSCNKSCFIHLIPKRSLEQANIKLYCNSEAMFLVYVSQMTRLPTSPKLF